MSSVGCRCDMVWHSRVLCPTQHITGYFKYDFTGQMTQPTAS